MRARGAAVIGLTIGDDGIPATAEGRLKAAASIVERAAKLGIPAEDVVIDPLVMTVGSDSHAALVTLRTIELVRQELGTNINLGASNVSFGLPDRPTVNQAFLAMAIEAGATCSITDPIKLGATIRASDVLVGHDDHAMRYIKYFRADGGTQREGEGTRPRMTTTHRLVALPSGESGQVAEGTSLRTALREIGVGIESLCAENATCGKCKILIEDGPYEQYGVVSSGTHASPPKADELDYLALRTQLFLRRGWKADQVRLSCQARILGDLVVTVPDETRTDRQIVRKTASIRRIEIRPSIRKYLVELTPPSLGNPKADWDRLASGLATSIGLVRAGEAELPTARDLIIDRACLQNLPAILRQSDWRVTASVWQDHEVIRIEPGLSERLVGAALDIGTTTLALYICDLTSGDVLAVESDLNPQLEFGGDVMSRIQYCLADPTGLEVLHKAIIKAVNRLLVRGAADAGITTDDILELVMVGNTTMQHLFLNLSPAHLGVAPFSPVISAPVDVRARELRLGINPSANVHVLPAIASFIGADTTAVLVAEAPHEQDENWLIIDIGTNAELVLGSRRQLVCASTPTGPALEGAHIEHGMRAAPGAIEHVRIDEVTFEPHWKLIGQEEWDTGRPKGLCGSAVVDATAELVRVGLVDTGGRLRGDRESGGRVRVGQGGPEFVIVTADATHSHADICFTQKDIRQVQLAKGALFVAARSLLDHMGLDSPDKLLLAGAFGSYIDKKNAMAIGMLPKMDLDQVYVVGNAAGDGARIALLSRDKRQEAVEIARRLTRYELPADPEFQQRFIQALAFPQPQEQPRWAK